MVYSNIRAQYPTHGPGSLFSMSNSSLSSTSSYDMSSLTSTPASSTSSLPLSYLNQNNKTLPALPAGVDPGFLQQQQRPLQFQHRGLPSLPSPPTPLPTSYKIPTASRRQTTIESTRVEAPKKIPRPPNSFMIYRREQAALHRGLMASQLSMILGKKWEAEPAERKAHFAKLARQAQEEHARRYPEYKFMPARRGTGKKAQLQAARKASAAASAGSYFASKPSASVYLPSSSLPAPSPSLVSFSTMVENNSRRLPALPQYREAQTQLLPAAQQRVAPVNYSPSTPTTTNATTTHRFALAPLPTHDLPSSLFFDSCGTPAPQNTFFALYSNLSPFTPSGPLPSGNSIVLETQSPSVHIPTMYSSSLQGVSTPPVPCPPLMSSWLPPISPLSPALTESDIIALSWETCTPFEGTPPTPTATSQVYIAEAFKSFPGPSPSEAAIYDSQQSVMPAYSFQPVSETMSLPSSSSWSSLTTLASLASPVWAPGPLSNSIMMENGSALSPTLPYCSSLSTSASSSFSELSPFSLLNTPLNDPSFLIGHEKECFLPEFPSRII